jgi:large subunit ribosomal protein L34
MGMQTGLIGRFTVHSSARPERQRLTLRFVKGHRMHYPRRVSRIKKIRKQGFRARMKTSSGQKIVNRQRRRGRSINVR